MSLSIPYQNNPGFDSANVQLTGQLGVHNLSKGASSEARIHDQPHHPINVVVIREKMSSCSRACVALLTVVVLAAIAVLAMCVTAVLGFFPLFLSFLNIFTVGACVSLPTIVCMASVVLFLSMLAIHNVVSKNAVTFHLQSSATQ